MFWGVWPEDTEKILPKEYGAPQEEDFAEDSDAYEEARDAWLIQTDVGQAWNAMDAEAELSRHDSCHYDCPLCRAHKEPDWKTGCGAWKKDPNSNPNDDK